MNNRTDADVVLFRTEQNLYIKTREQRIKDIRNAFASDATFISSIVDAAIKELKNIVDCLENLMRSVKSMNNLLGFLDD